MLGVFEAHSDLRSIIIGNVTKQPEVGKKMDVIETTISPSSDDKYVNVEHHVRVTTKVTHAEPIDGLRLWKVSTQSGRTYIVEVMG